MNCLPSYLGNILTQQTTEIAARKKRVNIDIFFHSTTSKLLIKNV